VLYVAGSGNNNVYALNAQTGTKLWSYDIGSLVEASPSVANGMMYVGSINGGIYAFGLPRVEK
jgi:eukaryotic-like serine/threonine-protein kinase